MSDETSGKGPGDRKAYRPDPRYTEGDLVRVVQAMNQAEAEFVQALLREEGIPSMLRRTRGFDVPDMVAAGPRDVMVPQTAQASARDVLLQAEIVRDEPTRMTPPARRPAALPTRAVRRVFKFMGIYPPA